VRPRGQATDGARGLGAAWAVMHKFFLGGGGYKEFIYVYIYIYYTCFK
jgi:hypothetical protein